MSEFRPERRHDHPTDRELVIYVDTLHVGQLAAHLEHCHQCARRVNEIRAEWEVDDE